MSTSDATHACAGGGEGEDRRRATPVPTPPPGGQAASDGASGPEDPVVGGVLVRLSRDVELRESAMVALAAHPAVTLGERMGRWLTLAVEARNASAGRDVHAWLATVPGVEWVEVVAVHFEGASYCQSTPLEWEVSA